MSQGVKCSCGFVAQADQTRFRRAEDFGAPGGRAGPPGHPFPACPAFPDNAELGDFTGRGQEDRQLACRTWYDESAMSSVWSHLNNCQKHPRACAFLFFLELRYMKEVIRSLQATLCHHN